uniref:U6 snRNA-associated Sm-like protein LSm8 n=1 Tax=Ostreococcus mediterraneus TaxID=1486918 RepID=A0A7S0TCV1_9CHLO
MAATGVSFRTDTRTLASMVDARVSVITNDGRHIVGVLRGFDQVVNVILEDCHERVYSTTSGVEHAPLGLYMIRGDNIAVVGALDEDLDAEIDFTGVVAAPLRPIKF